MTSQMKLTTEFMIIAWETPTKEAANSIGNRLCGSPYSKNEARREQVTPTTRDLFRPILRDKREVLAEVMIEQKYSSKMM